MQHTNNLSHHKRFAVGNPYGARSSIWSIIAGEPPKSDVYISCGSLGGKFKISLHESGESHITCITEFIKRKVQHDQWQFDSCYVDQWNRNESLVSGFNLALRINILASELRECAGEIRRPNEVFWIKPPGPRHFIEVVILITSALVEPDEWPARDSLGTILLDRQMLPNGLILWVVYREAPVSEGLLNNIKRLQDKLAVDPSADKLDLDVPNSERYFILGGVENDGSRFIMEVALDNVRLPR